MPTCGTDGGVRVKLETYIVPANVTDERLWALTRRMLPQVPERALREAFARRDVKMDGVRVPREAEPTPGATVAVYLPQEEALLAPRILYEDAHLIVIDKPAGVSCEVDEKGGLTVGAWLYRICADRLSAPPLPCHRLDNPTDGLLLLAKDESTRAAMEQAFRERRVSKRYQCLVRGSPKPPEADLQAYLLKDARHAKVSILDRPAPGALPIHTAYRTLSAGEVSRLEIALYTGRTHQIRAHLAHIGHPLLGDDKYGDRTFNREHRARRLMLTASSINFTIKGEYAYLNDIHVSLPPKF